MIPLENYIDHTLLKPSATTENIIQLCKEAKKYNFFAVCVNGSFVGLAKRELANSNIKIVAVVGFPLGATSPSIKVLETKTCINNGADEIDMVINVGMLKSKDFKYVENEIQAVKNEVGNRVLKVIIETCYLTDEEKKIACKLAMNAGADFVKTSTGFGSNGATTKDILLMKEVVKEQLKIKASGGISNKETALNFISMGISRIGTSSGIKIVT
ncbi:deoxyribose-phosphate aldolase [Flavobacteriaceae bacterium]|nr:deoxyribose-phosphate aldolase [Flavobacteriaceae bacterium]|tara:strand:+ start:2993 stop:3634 length:642 start_codon:yes stop_codon:yes gene_type:complete